MAPTAMSQEAFARFHAPYYSRECRNLVEQFAACRTPELGGRLLRCTECGTQIVEYNRCNARGCPNCGPERQAEWRHRIGRQILPMGHFHLTFSGPEYLVGVWLADSRGVMNALFAAAAAALKGMMKEAGLTFGQIMVFHSHGRGMSYKPHIHCLLTPGGVDSQNHWREYKTIRENRLREQFRSRMLTRLRSCAPRYLHGEIQSDSESGWSVYCVFHPESGSRIVSYFSRSLFGVVIDTRYALEVEADKVTFTEDHEGQLVKTTLSHDEYVLRRFRHIPPANAVTVRHYGLYSNRMAGLRERIRCSLGQTLEEDPTETQPQCPECHAQMEVTHTFTAEQLPAILRLYRLSRGSPWPHRARITPPAPLELS